MCINSPCKRIVPSFQCWHRAENFWWCNYYYYLYYQYLYSRRREAQSCQRVGIYSREVRHWRDDLLDWNYQWLKLGLMRKLQKPLRMSFVRKLTSLLMESLLQQWLLWLWVYSFSHFGLLVLWTNNDRNEWHFSFFFGIIKRFLYKNTFQKDDFATVSGERWKKSPFRGCIYICTA